MGAFCYKHKRELPPEEGGRCVFCWEDSLLKDKENIIEKAVPNSTAAYITWDGKKYDISAFTLKDLLMKNSQMQENNLKILNQNAELKQENEKLIQELEKFKEYKKKRERRRFSQLEIDE